MSALMQLLFFSALSLVAAQETSQVINPHCLNGSSTKTKEVTHYMIPLLEAYDHQICDVMEGTCIYREQATDTQWIHNVGYKDVPVLMSHCQNGWGNQHNCLHPCRTIAASMKYHQFGQIVFIKALVGLKCGNLERDGFEFNHDGYVVVTDTGSPKYFHEPGRFDFFWGRCKNQKNGVCNEGAEPISDATSHSDYCTVWDPRHPKTNQAVKDAFVAKVKSEDTDRGDIGAASDFNL